VSEGLSERVVQKRSEVEESKRGGEFTSAVRVKFALQFRCGASNGCEAKV